MNGSNQEKRHRSNRSSLPLVAVLIGSVVGAGVTRGLVLGQRNSLDQERGVVSSGQANLSKLNSFALGLLLGGLRGPLVMALWTSSENQKTERQLEDFDTKVDLIRLLQPEFDTVHLFQIWNKAYNISVQMANVPNKYTTILDALEYGFEVDRERPDNINILSSIGGLYFDKFGNAQEKGYYSPRLREETLPLEETRVRMTFAADKKAEVLRAARLQGASAYSLVTREAAGGDVNKLTITVSKTVADRLKAQNLAGVEYADRTVVKAARSGAAGKAAEHPTILDASFRLLPEYLAPRTGRQATGDAADGSQLPYLKEFEPFPLGVSPHALAYNYFKRCEWLQSNRGLRHSQLSDRVVSSRPALALKKWSDEDWYAGRRGEMELANRPVPPEESLYEPVTQDLPLDNGLPASPLYDEVIARYERAAKIADRAVVEYQAHNKRFVEDELTYRSHVKNAEAQAALLKADALYLQAAKAQGEERRKLVNDTRAAYARAADLYARHILRYFIDEETFTRLAQDVARGNLFQSVKRPEVDVENSKLDDRNAIRMLLTLRQQHVAAQYELAESEDFKEIDSYVQRAHARMASIDNWTRANPAK